MQSKRRQIFALGTGARGLALGAVTAALVAASTIAAGAEEASCKVPVLKSADLGDWTQREFSGETRYTPVTLDGRRVLEARSEGAASGLYRKITVDLYETPVLNWRWRVENIFPGIDEKTRDGDDYPARVYVVSAHPVFFWKTRAISYVWSSSQPQGSSWPNAYTENARMVAAQSGSGGVGAWQEQSRNVRRDFETYFGADVRYVDAVAVMTDTDNSGRRATAYYGDVCFAAR